MHIKIVQIFGKRAADYDLRQFGYEIEVEIPPLAHLLESKHKVNVAGEKRHPAIENNYCCRPIGVIKGEAIGDRPPPVVSDNDNPLQIQIVGQGSYIRG
jgi:hypothetical protein